MPESVRRMVERLAHKGHPAFKRKSKKPAFSEQKPDKDQIETRDGIFKRLNKPKDYKHDGWVAGPRLVGTVETPDIPTKEMYVIPEEELGSLLDDIAEIKQLLFCRLVLSHATLLPSALKASSVEEFLADSEDEPSADEGDDEDAVVGKPLTKRQKFRKDIRAKWGAMEWKSKIEQQQENARKRKNKPGSLLDFGEVDDKGVFREKKIRVKICGKSIWNYASENAMSRNGWLHFCILAKGVSLFEAIELCRNWREFYELNTLAIWSYFPSSSWADWANNVQMRQLAQLGLVCYFTNMDADNMTVRQQSGSRYQGRSHRILEFRGFICAQMNRLDPISRRFLTYVNMNYTNLLVLVRDGHTGEILVQPFKEEDRWLVRHKEGIGRAAKNKWKVISQVDEKFFEQMDHLRLWRFGFDQYYDVVIWDRFAGRRFAYLHNTVQDLLMKAHRVCEAAEYYRQAEPVLKTIRREAETLRVRDARPGDRTVWDTVRNSSGKAYDVDSETGEITESDDILQGYQEADALEDEVLFPEDCEGEKKGPLSRPGPYNELQRLEEGDFPWDKFIEDADTDEEYSDEDEDYGQSLMHQLKMDVDKDHPRRIRELNTYDTDDDWEDDEDDYEYVFEGETGKTEEGLEELEDGVEETEDEVEETEEKREQQQERRLELRQLVERPPFSVDGAMFRRTLETSRKVGPILEGIQKSPEELKCSEILDKWLDDPDAPVIDSKDIPAAFNEFNERYRAKIFKQTFHAADLEPGAYEKYDTANAMIAAATPYYFGIDAYRLRCLQTLQWLGTHPNEHRHVGRDVAAMAYAMASFFFDHGDGFFESEKGSEFAASLLQRQAERSFSLPDVRNQTSSAYRPKEFWEEFDSKQFSQAEDCEAVREIYPPKWDLIAGMIKPTDDASGIAFPATEPGRTVPDLFFDWRQEAKGVTFPSDMLDPSTVPPLLSCAQKYASSKANARFAFLRVWSAPHFYPLMMGVEKRKMCSFTDSVGRCWEWKFVPKDMPYSDWSIHFWARNTLERGRFGRLWRKSVMVKRDAIIVMAQGEEELRKLVTGVIYAVQTKPWFREIDSWKSFINVELDFLEKLDEKWLE
ncbi:hypothetical protein NA57DRAFT_80538 [Rhizodiscina lignyota]|uniref:Uncharacterized protein n=1 Tax=Rhizodiscina lignyota TaxID=1504668 RepID=A0A9P4M233_9PEZI|nr:hypothetical protein NA57DRAFT_80538 [Rhizodiscina lignyota]